MAELLLAELFTYMDMERVKMATTKPNIQIDDEVREMNDEEFKALKADQKESAAAQAKITAKEAARQSALLKLSELGLTAEEIAAL